MVDIEDTREQLEADILAHYKTPEEKLKTVREWLDRQAAITERELCGRCSPYATAKDYLDTIDSLTAERDRLQKVVQIQADSFQKLEHELREELDKEVGR